MKNFWIIILLLIIGLAPANAGTCKYNCVEPYDLAGSTSKVLTNITGVNFLAKNIAQHAIKNALLKNSQGDYKIDVESFSILDLKKGIFKTLSITGKNVLINGLSISDFSLKTLCNFNYILLEDENNPKFKEDMPISFSMELSQDDLNYDMKNSEFMEMINSINKTFSTFRIFNISDMSVKITKNQLFILLNVSSSFFNNPQTIVLNTDLKILDGKIDFTNTKLVNNKFNIDVNMFNKIINYVNPLDFSLNIMENKNADINIQNAKIINDKINIDGMIFIPKDI